jgi:3-carboxy-cis,cis-muconate cycloisomerase
VDVQAGLFSGVFARGRVDTGSRAWLRAMLDTEAALARAVERAGLAPAGAGAAVTAAAAAAATTIDPAVLGRQAALTGNPVPALVRELTKLVQPDAAGAVHRGATSQDIIDTAAMLLARQALAVIGADLAAAADSCAGLALAHRDTLMLGRTLLQQAVPVTFGLVAAGWLTSLDEARQAVGRVLAERLAIQFGGAAGTLASLGADGPRVAGLLAGELGLACPVIPWHTDRLRVIDVGAACAAACAAPAKIARDVTLLAQPEVGEARETGEDGGTGDGVRRGGSSAMPHKQNPVAAIAILGCARQVPGLVATLIAAAEQEHQRAAGAWHAEWEPFAGVLRLTGSAASWGAELVRGLTVDPGRMRANLEAARGLPLAEHVAGLLAPAMGRDPAHDLVAGGSVHAVTAGVSLGDALLGVPELRRQLDAAGVTPEQVVSALDPAGYLGAAHQFTDAALAAHAQHERAG